MSGEERAAASATRVLTTVRGRARAILPRSMVRDLTKDLKRAMVAAGEAGAELTLSLVDDDEIQTLNREYRGQDQPTDVLSFSLREGEGLKLPSLLLGDVVISIETALRQADAAGHLLADELFHLAVHGLAHLCGYDHATLREERIMFGWEAELREAARQQRDRGGRAKTRTVARPARGRH